MQVDDRPGTVRRGVGDVTADAPDDLNDQLDRTAHGQAVTSRVLARIHDRGWLHLDDLHWPGRARAVIDHVAVGPGGIIVLTTVNWIGKVDVREGRIHHNGRASASQVGAETAAIAVQGVLPEDLQRHVVPALSVITVQSLDGVAGNVLASSSDNLELVLTRRPTVLDEKQVARAAALLWATLSVGGGGLVGKTNAQQPGRLVGWWRGWRWLQ